MDFKVGDKVTTRDGRKAKITGISATFYRIICKDGEKIICGESQIKPRFPWKKFKNGEFAVHCKTNKEARDLLEKLAKHNCRWNNGEEVHPCKTEWGCFKEKTSYGCGLNNSGGLTFADREFYSDHNYTILEWSDYMKPDLHQTIEQAGENIVKGIAAGMNPEERFKREYLKHLKDGGYNWIARDASGKVYAYIEKPERIDATWHEFTHIAIRIEPCLITLPEVPWENPEPTPIEDLIKEKNK